MLEVNAGFRDLMQRIREGSDDAAWELVERYGDDLRRAVRRLLNVRLRSKFDSLDFVQVVWSSFFRARDQMERFDSPEMLAKFLITMTRNKVIMEVRRRLQTKKYNVNRESPLEEPQQVGRELAGNEPTPVNVAIARERLNQMLAEQPPHYRRIIKLRLEGHTYDDIARQLHLAESTVRRFIKKLFHETVT
jgi:RNA polymerase sigma-70 factor (ECF subfamily)